ncbi:ATP-binding cassette domain-containing protein [Leucobacter chromiireducens]|uniref:ATP-binding cassette domain-containing protein n=1 Tax=Leucobacter chromiireducens TaxID=283877 RepID=UPI003F81DF10
MTIPLLDTTGLSVTAPGGARVLTELELTVAPGECLAVVGSSGAGKSVLARTLLGLTQASPRWRVEATTLSVAGRDMRRATQRQWRGIRGATVGLVLQDALQSLDPLRTIGAEVGEALALRGVRGAERRAAVIAALQAAGLPDAEARLAQRPGELSGGMRQRALIAAALAAQPPLLIADEPTTALDSATAARVLDHLSGIRDAGTGVLLISHDLGAVARVADRVAVLEAGRIVECAPSAEFLARPSTPAGRALVAAIPRGAKPGPPPRPGRELIALTEASRLFPAPAGGTTGLRSVSLTLRAGEALGVVGESGAGKTTLARVLAGADRPDSGTLAQADPPPRARLIPQDPLATFDPRWRVERIIAASIRPDQTSSGAQRTPAELLRTVGLDPELLRRRPVSLSGGQRQRVAIARALAARPDVLVCDEPVSALDMATQAGILALLRKLQEREHVALVFVSHDLAAVRAVADRTLIMRDGSVIEEGPTEQVFRSPQHEFTRELLAATGVSGSV